MSKGAIALIVVESEILFIDAARHTFEGCNYELPRGGAEDEESDIDCAIREAHEEAGVNIKKSDCSVIGHVRPDTGVLTTEIPVVIACHTLSEGEVPTSMFSEGESRSVHLFSAQRISKAIREGKITCGISLAALMLFQEHIRFNGQDEKNLSRHKNIKHGRKNSFSSNKI